MAVEINDERNLVKVNPLDANKVVIQEVNTQVKVTGFGPQGAVGPAGAAGAAGAQGEPGRFTVSETAPASPTAGDAWFRSSSAQLYLYYDGYWVETSTSYAGPAGATGATGATGSQGATGDQGESFSFRGAYGGSEIVYNLNDVVTYNGSSYICLSNNVSGSQPDSLVSWDILVEKGATGATGAGYYGSFYHTATVLLNSATTAFPLPLNTTAEATGVSIASGSRITVANAGVYNIQFSAQLDKTDGANDLVNIWFAKNGVNIDNSNTQILVQGNNGKHVASWNFVLTLAANDYVQIMLQSPDINMRVLASGVQTNPARPAVPSAIVTVTQVG